MGSNQLARECAVRNLCVMLIVLSVACQVKGMHVKEELHLHGDACQKADSRLLCQHEV